ncbi:MAG: response regulator [Proteobacteria bacterium]|nr:response regulator [Pseudomonadota bacterium]
MSTLTILVVDDEYFILDLITRCLTNDKYRILTAQSAEEGLKLLIKNQVHLVISDQRMPGMTGLNFLRKVKANYPDIITIILTGYADIETVLEAINSTGVYKFMLKPMNMIDLRITVQRALEWRQMIIDKDLLSDKIKTYEARLKELERLHPGITDYKTDESGNIILDLE